MHPVALGRQRLEAETDYYSGSPVFASRGEKDAALLELEAMVDAGWRWLTSPGFLDWMVYSIGSGWFEDSPLLDSIRDEPRFVTAAKRVTDDNAAMLAELDAGLTLEDISDEDVVQ